MGHVVVSYPHVLIRLLLEQPTCHPGTTVYGNGKFYPSKVGSEGRILNFFNINNLKIIYVKIKENI